MHFHAIEAGIDGVARGLSVIGDGLADFLDAQCAWHRHVNQAIGTESLAGGADRRRRSEEHTSELQSLMRISYAVFCLKKKKHILIRYTIIHTTLKYI